MAAVALIFASGCGSSTSAVDRASDEVKDVVADIEAATPPASYQFTYTAISPFFMACMSGVEDIVGAVDAATNAMLLAPVERRGDVYSLDGELLIHRDLLGFPDRPSAAYLRVRLDTTTDSAERSRIDNALGSSLSALVAGGAWPNHPNDIVRALVQTASSITSITSDDPTQRGIRIILDADTYTRQIGTGAGSAGEVPPIIDVHVSADGAAQRLVVRLPDPTEPTTLRGNSEGYAMDFHYDPHVVVAPPGPESTAAIAANELPSGPTPIPCQVEQ